MKTSILAMMAMVMAITTTVFSAEGEQLHADKINKQENKVIIKDRTQEQETLTLENGRVGLSFNRSTGTLIAIQNKLVGETYQVRDDSFEVEACEFRVRQADAKLTSLQQEAGAVKSRYEAGEITIEVAYTLSGDNHFAEKRLTLTSARNYGLKNVTLSQPVFSADGLRIVTWRYPRINAMRKLINLNEAPTCTFFARTPKGGLFAGVEVPFDSSTTVGQQVVLRYAPSLKVTAGERLDCEPVYFGVYRRGPHDDEKQVPQYNNLWANEKQELPLQSESDAMVDMVTKIFGGPRFGLVAKANGWHSELSHGPFTEQSVTGDMQSLDFLVECGIEFVSDAHPWGGNQKKIRTLGTDGKYEPSPLLCKYLEHARKTNVKVCMFSSMNDIYEGPVQSFCTNQPDWLMDAGATPPNYAPEWRKKELGNCLAHRPFFNWLVRINSEAIAAGYKGWGIDGDFFGSLGYAFRADCQSDKHEHLQGDSNYACQRALMQLQAAVRERFPETYISMARPTQDLGVWAQRNVDVCFTILEDSGYMDNFAGGDKIRTWSRVRVHREFLPHYLDQPLLFPAIWYGKQPGKFPSEHMDYILLSALSSSPKQLYYLPTKTGLPAADKAEIRKWLDWGRKNIEYLKVRKDLPDWPAPGKVDGSAHILGDRGLVFLFNSGNTPLSGEFALTEESIGLKGQGDFQIAQEYPVSDHSVKAAFGETVRWEVPAKTAVVLRIQQDGKK